MISSVGFLLSVLFAMLFGFFDFRRVGANTTHHHQAGIVHGGVAGGIGTGGKGNDFAVGRYIHAGIVIRAGFDLLNKVGKAVPITGLAIVKSGIFRHQQIDGKHPEHLKIVGVPQGLEHKIGVLLKVGLLFIAVDLRQHRAIPHVVTVHGHILTEKVRGDAATVVDIQFTGGATDVIKTVIQIVILPLGPDGVRLALLPQHNNVVSLGVGDFQPTDGIGILAVILIQGFGHFAFVRKQQGIINGLGRHRGGSFGTYCRRSRQRNRTSAPAQGEAEAHSKKEDRFILHPVRLRLRIRNPVWFRKRGK